MPQAHRRPEGESSGPPPSPGRRRSARRSPWLFPRLAAPPSTRGLAARRGGAPDRARDLGELLGREERRRGKQESPLVERFRYGKPHQPPPLHVGNLQVIRVIERLRLDPLLAEDRLQLSLRTREALPHDERDPAERRHGPRDVGADAKAGDPRQKLAVADANVAADPDAQ